MVTAVEGRQVRAAPLASLQSIPPEIYTEILQHLSLEISRNKEAIKTLCSLSLVCRSLRDIAQIYLFQHLEPKSQKSLKLLLRVLRSTPQLASHVESLYGLTFAWRAHISNTQLWRSHWIFLYPTAVTESRYGNRIQVTLADCKIATNRFIALIDLCPNLRRLSLPTWTLFRQWETNPFPLNSTCAIPPHLAYNLQSLTLSCVAFSDLNPGHEEIRLPELRYLALVEATIASPYRKYLDLPNLTHLLLRSVRGSSEGLQDFVASIEYKLESMACLDVHVWNTPLSDPLLPSDANLVMRRPLGITVLGTSGGYYNSAIMALWQFLSVTEFILSTRPGSSFAELNSPPSTMQRLSIRHDGVNDFRRGHLLFSSILTLLKKKHELVPCLTEISIYWTLRRDIFQRDVAKLLVYCLLKFCTSEKVALNVTIHLGKSASCCFGDV